ncbi:SRPBCC domain-containing protein [Arenibacter sp. 6A1]|uniref:SRPBCC family protein n=1 Tax=Arenibacter sp. 6A1 TaxID=2720391 RepID=UPI00293BED08|nr:SRPBCC domain-containing protein [Arenibacter sp. 6A1]
MSLYNAWTDLKTFQQWFFPIGFSVVKAELDPKVGGGRIHMKSPEGVVYPTKGEYLLLQKSDRIVYKDSWDEDRENNVPVTTEVKFQTIGTETRIVLYSSFANNKQKDQTMKSGIINGWKMFFQNLNNVLKNK